MQTILAMALAACAFMIGDHRVGMAQQSTITKTPQQETVHNGVVSWLTTDFPVDVVTPVLDLSQVIKRHLRQKKFKVCWEYAVGGSGFGHAVYDRTTRTLRFMAANVDAGIYKLAEHNLYSSVTDDLLHRLAQDVGNREKTALNLSSKAYYFDHLRTYSCGWRGQLREWDLGQ